VRVWRIARGVHPLFDGEGTRRFGSRWIPRGLPAVHASATLSLAALELLVHTDPDLIPHDLVSVAVDIPESLTVESVDVRQLAKNWREYPAPEALQELGRRWIEESAAVALSLPSAVIPIERNVIINPNHPEFAALEIGKAERFAFDQRLMGRR
jgi:RES domain-containing protein